jgi:hypothetical protein
MSESRGTTKKVLMEHVERDWSALNRLLSRLSETQWTNVKNRDGWATKNHMVVLCGSVGNSRFPMLDAWISGSRVGTHSARLNQIPITSASSGGFWPFFSRERIAHTLAGVYLTCRACCVTQASSGWGYSLQDARVGCQSRPKRGRARRAARLRPSVPPPAPVPRHPPPR